MCIALREIGYAFKDDILTLVLLLAEALKDDDEFIRLNSIQLLGELQEASTPAITALTETLNDKDYYVRKAAVIALEKIQK